MTKQLTRPLLLMIIVLNSNYAFADWPLIHFLKCRITTKDTVVTGYFTAPFEGMRDSTLAKLKNDKKYFESNVLKRMTTIELNEFTYIHYYSSDNDSSREHAIYKSSDRLMLDVKTIENIALLEIINFQFVPNRIVSKITMSDTLWMCKPVFKIYQDKERCYPYRFLVYDKTIDYEKIIAEAMIHSDQRESMLEGLSKNKILALRLNLCD